MIGASQPLSPSAQIDSPQISGDGAPSSPSPSSPSHLVSPANGTDLLSRSSLLFPESDLARFLGADYAASFARDVIVPAVRSFPRLSQWSPPDGVNHLCVLCQESGFARSDLILFHDALPGQLEHVACSACVVGLGMLAVSGLDGFHRCATCRLPSTWSFPSGGAGGLCQEIRRARRRGLPDSQDDFVIPVDLSQETEVPILSPPSTVFASLPSSAHTDYTLDEALERTSDILDLDPGEEIPGGALTSSYMSRYNRGDLTPEVTTYSCPLVQLLIIFAGLSPPFFSNFWRGFFPRRLWSAVEHLLMRSSDRDSHWSRALRQFWNSDLGPIQDLSVSDRAILIDEGCPLRERMRVFGLCVTFVHRQYLTASRQESILRWDYDDRMNNNDFAILQHLQCFLISRYWSVAGSRPRRAVSLRPTPSSQSN